MYAAGPVAFPNDNHFGEQGFELRSQSVPALLGKSRVLTIVRECKGQKTYRAGVLLDER